MTRGLVKRVLRILFAYSVATVSALIAIVIVAKIWSYPNTPLMPLSFSYLITFYIAGIIVIGVVAAPFAALVISVAEVRQIRSPLFYVGSATLTGFLGSILMYQGFSVDVLVGHVLLSFGGAAAGLIYWGIAGRTAGADCKAPLPGSR